MLILTRVPTATKYLTGAYILLNILFFFLRYRQLVNHYKEGYSIGYSETEIPLLQLIPSQTFYHLWTLVTSVVIETNVVKFFVNLATVFIGGKFIESSTSTESFTKFLLVVGGFSNLILCLFKIILSIFGANIHLDAPIDGAFLFVSFIVVYKQLAPETTIIQLGTVNFRFKMLPTFMLCVMSVAGSWWSVWWMAATWINFFIAWWYLRFWCQDASDNFELIYFFPDIFKPALKPVFNGCYDLWFHVLGFSQPFEEADIEASNVAAEKRGAKKVSERRRDLALKVLEERLQTEESV